MALNFPVDTSNPYVDPTTGLKYVYNQSVGAWESALQPPVIVSATQPLTAIEGFLWYNTSDSILYVYRSGAWNAASSATASGSEVRVSDTPNAVPSVGDLWWDTIEGQLYIYYIDPDGGSFWMPCSPTVSAAGGGAYVNASAPPTASQGDLWFNTSNNSLNVYDGTQWTSALNEVAGVNALTGTSPIVVDNTDPTNPVVEISAATTSASGAVRLATQLEVNDGTLTDVAITPSTLTNGIDNYLPQATEISPGVVELATQAETDAGTDTLKVVTPATLAAAVPSLGLSTPAGIVSAYAGATAPAGYLLCDGSIVAAATYPALYAAIGTTYGGDATNFQLPDLRAEFIRGLDNSRGQDPGRLLGSNQGHQVESHTHTGPSGNAGSDPSLEGGGRRDNTVGTYTTNAYPSSVDGANETRPRNVAMNYIIKT